MVHYTDIDMTGSEAVCSSYLIGRENETATEVLRLILPPKYLNCKFTFDFQLEDGSLYSSPSFDYSDTGKIEYTLPHHVMRKGILIIGVRAEDSASGYMKRIFERSFVCTENITSSKEGVSSDVIDRLVNQIKLLEECCRRYGQLDFSVLEKLAISDLVLQYPYGADKDDFLLCADYSSENLDYVWANEFFEERYREHNIGACSSVRNGNWIGRNYDWYYDNSPSIVVQTAAINGRHAVIGVAQYTPITMDKADSRSPEDVELYKILPFLLLDGMNDAGVYANINVTAVGDRGTTTGTNPDGYDLCGMSVVRYVLDHANSAYNAIELLQTMNIWFPHSNAVNEEFHFMISDKNETYIVEFADNRMIYHKAADEYGNPAAIMTNFSLVGADVQTWFDGSYVSRADATEADDYFKPTEHPMGVERFDILKAGFANANNKSGMKSLMESVKYSQTYDAYKTPYWYSELSADMSDTPYGDLAWGTPIEEYEPLKQHVIELYESEQALGLRESKTWHTVHTSVYDIENGFLYLYTQENYGKEFLFFADFKGNVVRSIDALNEKAHEHPNKPTLDKLLEEDGKLTYNGKKLGAIETVAELPQDSDENTIVYLSSGENGGFYIMRNQSWERIVQENIVGQIIVDDYSGLPTDVPEHASAYVRNSSDATVPLFRSKLDQYISEQKVFEELFIKETPTVIPEGTEFSIESYSESDDLYYDVVNSMDWSEEENTFYLYSGDGDVVWIYSRIDQPCIDSIEGSLQAGWNKLVAEAHGDYDGTVTPAEYSEVLRIENVVIVGYNVEDLSADGQTFLNNILHEVFMLSGNYVSIDAMAHQWERIPSNEQADWNETDQTSLAFIKNKPDIVGQKCIAEDAEIFNSYSGAGKNVASGICSHAEGRFTSASVRGSHAEGSGTTASGICSHAEGDRTTASGDYSHAEGYRTTASANYSHAEGRFTSANGDCSHAEGDYTSASGDYSHVEGKYNIDDTNGRYQAIVGNGRRGEPPLRSNMFTRDWDGNVWIKGDIYVGGTSQDNAERITHRDDVIPLALRQYDTLQFRANLADVPVFIYDRIGFGIELYSADETEYIRYTDVKDVNGLPVPFLTVVTDGHEYTCWLRDYESTYWGDRDAGWYETTDGTETAMENPPLVENFTPAKFVVGIDEQTTEDIVYTDLTDLPPKAQSALRSLSQMVNVDAASMGEINIAEDALLRFAGVLDWNRVYSFDTTEDIDLEFSAIPWSGTDRQCALYIKTSGAIDISFPLTTKFYGNEAPAIESAGTYKLIVTADPFENVPIVGMLSCEDAEVST